MRNPHIVGITFFLCSVGAAAWGQEPARPMVRESVAIDVNFTAQRQLDLARVQLEAQRWSEAFDLMRQAIDADGSGLIRVAAGRYLKVRTFVQVLAASLPPDGLAAYRKWSGANAEREYNTATARHDAGLLQDLLSNSFATKASEAALRTLGQWAWESGDVDQARVWWQRLIPPRGEFPAGTCPVLRYPDASIGRAEILARLVMCSLAEGDFHRADAERRALLKIAPDARGTIAGEKGKLHDLLAAAAVDARSWRIPPRDTQVATYAVNASRNGLLPSRAHTDVGGVRWRKPLDGDRFARDSTGGREEGLNFFPVSYRDFLFAASADRIDAWDIRTGKPAWPGGRDESATIYPSVLPETRFGLSPTRMVGSPKYTMTIEAGRLYARMGSPITVRARRDLQASDSSLVCLDLEHGEGNLLWKLEAAALDPPAAFEGSPVVVAGRAYAVVRQIRPQAQTDAICLDAENGRLQWRRKICSLASLAKENENLMTNQLLTWGDDSLFLTTAAGAVAAIDAVDGATNWVATYEGLPWRDRPVAEWESSPPCLYAESRVFAAGGDIPGIMALDSRTGGTLWRHDVRGGVDHLLGVHEGLLVASGKHLHGFDAATGRLMWRLGFEDPAGWGYGRGILAEHLVYWPLRDELLAVDVRTGQLQQRIPLETVYGESGGNLSLLGDALVIAQPGRVVVFGPHGHRPSAVDPMLSSTPRNSRR